MKTERIPQFNERLPQKPKKTAHESGELFQIYLNNARDQYGERSMTGIKRLNGPHSKGGLYDNSRRFEEDQ